jgi:hypothetical protein
MIFDKHYKEVKCPPEIRISTQQIEVVPEPTKTQESSNSQDTES